jgi:signal transduction histidine kinase
MKTFALICSEDGVIKELINEDQNPFKGSVNQLFSTNNHILDIQKALNFLLEIKNKKVTESWEITLEDGGTPIEYNFRGLLHDGEIIIIGEEKSIDRLNQINAINADFSSLIREITNENIDSRRQFMQVVSHELRTPNTAISGYVEMILENYEESIPEEAYRWLEIVMNNANRLGKITDGLLILEEAEDGAIKPERTFLRPDVVVSEILSEKQDRISTKNLEIETCIKVEEIYTDSRMIRSILDSLIDNAIKFSPEKSKIIVTLSEKGEIITIKVRDQGIGIKEEDLSRVFEPFSNIQKPDYYPGIGISLAISKAYTEALKGKIYAKSEGIGEGSTFTVEIPLTQTK